MARGIRCPRVSSKTTSNRYLTCERQGCVWRPHLGQLITPSCALTATSQRPPCFTGVWRAGRVTLVRGLRVVFKVHGTLEAIGNSSKKQEEQQKSHPSDHAPGLTQ